MRHIFAFIQPLQLHIFAFMQLQWGCTSLTQSRIWPCVINSQMPKMPSDPWTVAESSLTTRTYKEHCKQFHICSVFFSRHTPTQLSVSDNSMNRDLSPTTYDYKIILSNHEVSLCPPILYRVGQCKLWCNSVEINRSMEVKNLAQHAFMTGKSTWIFHSSAARMTHLSLF